MENQLATLESKVDQVVGLCQALRGENAALKAQLAAAEARNADLTARMAAARTRVETLLARVPEDK